MPLHTRSRLAAWLAIVALLYDAQTGASAQSQTSVFLPIEPMTRVDTTAGTGYFSDPYPIYVAEPWTSASIPRAFSGTTKDLLLCWHGLQPGCYAETPITIDPGPLAEQARQQGAVSSTFQNNNIFRGRDGIWQMVSTLNLRTAGAKSNATHWTVIVHAHPTAVSYSIPTAWVADTVLVGSLGQSAPANYDGKFFEDNGTLYLLYSSRLSDNPAHDGVVAQTMQSAMRPASSPPVTMLQPEVINGGFNAELFHPTDPSDQFKLVEKRICQRSSSRCRSQVVGTIAAKTQAFAYLRTSSAANVGEDRDSDKRQAAAISAYAKRAGVEVVETFYDAAVRGGDPIDTRPGFAAMLERIEGTGVCTIVVETANRFARDLMVQEVGFAMLQKRGINLIAADSPTSFLDDTPTARLIRQVLGAVSEFEKAMVVAKLRGARDRKRKTGVKVEGRKSITETKPEVVELARRLNRKAPKGGRRTLREISAELATAGHLTRTGKPYAPAAVAKMLDAKP